jgi:hypothetical protein
MVRVNVHNAVVILGLVVLGILALRALAKTQLGNIPVLGDVLKLGATA